MGHRRLRRGARGPAAEDRAAAAAAGFDAHVVEPVEADRLLELLAELTLGTDRQTAHA